VPHGFHRPSKRKQPAGRRIARAAENAAWSFIEFFTVAPCSTGQASAPLSIWVLSGHAIKVVNDRVHHEILHRGGISAGQAQAFHSLVVSFG